jgi:AmmeMemoRadiSam system protein B
MEIERTLRHPVVSGIFYPDDREELENTVSGYIEQVDEAGLADSLLKAGGGIRRDETPHAVIVPHAGYIFSARAQAHAYCLLKGARVDTAVLIGPAHQQSFPGISVNDDSAYRTPLGDVEVDRESVEKLRSFHDSIGKNEEAHLREHAIEVQLPFLQTVLPGVSIVPVLMGEQTRDTSLLLKNALVSLAKDLPKTFLLIVSSDLSHYHSHVEASVMDRVLLDDVESCDPEKFYEHIREGRSEACGFGGILSALMYVRETGRGRSAILYYTDSGEVSGDRKKVVGYLSAALY